MLNGAAVSWKSKKQSSTAMSSAEAEYAAATLAGKEITWARRLITELGIHLKGPTILLSDSMSCIAITKNPVLHQRTKHIELHMHFIRELVAKGYITVQYVSTNDQATDILTKALSYIKFLKFKQLIGVQQFPFHPAEVR